MIKQKLYDFQKESILIKYIDNTYILDHQKDLNTNLIYRTKVTGNTARTEYDRMEINLDNKLEDCIDS